MVVDVGSTNGTLVNGRLVRTHRLRCGDKIAFGAQGGPEVRFDIEDNFRRNGTPHGVSSPVQAPAVRRPPPDLGRAPAPSPAPSQDAAMLAREAQLRIAQARAGSKGQPSGQTMFIMADTFKKVEDVAEGRKRPGDRADHPHLLIGRRARPVIWQQKKQIEHVHRRTAGQADRQDPAGDAIESDPDK
jgi:hypothetical protein